MQFNWANTSVIIAPQRKCMHDIPSPHNGPFSNKLAFQRAFKKETTQWYVCYIVLPWQNDERTAEELVPRRYSRERINSQGCGCGGFGDLSQPSSKTLLFHVCCVWPWGVPNTWVSHHCALEHLLWSLQKKSKWKTCVDSRFRSRNPASDLSFWSLNRVVVFFCFFFVGPCLHN